MMPPMCAVCPDTPHADKPLSRFTLVYFRATRTYDDDWVGHPENAVWFCDDHAHLAEGLTDLTAPEALARIPAR
ncbi:MULTISPECIES: hypothetical protein [Streptomyces]|uniref:Uncharacterized protein n=1 Tax=Streptomyces caniscabiei TaxID=2746961 RepID=A0ABU4N1D0_9ACTN|nr:MULTISPECIES: hypothetical protein [Streptomyces]MBE4735488.1 hypothetical protein [Streptomyces caniscabiei]MBE4762576.1 hypothetical protein [Streptomyces caniscabiei]MBE4775882.1 hypothetical protein [Streptomyces caniscabiei]MBE4789131.1 hypothetical protein [Streptomyces caniscabiei]MBE4795906.1 hypothetical protein [Streptomyces caniscabiei]